MNLQKRINKLREDKREVYVTHRSLITFDGYHAREAASNFWTGAVIFLACLFVFSWIMNGVYWDARRDNTPAMVAAQAKVVDAEARKHQQEADDMRKAKQQYVDACKSSGKVPTDMGDRTDLWECK